MQIHDLTPTVSPIPIALPASAPREHLNTDVLSIVSSLAQKIEALTTQVNHLSRERNKQNVINSRKRSRSRTFNNDNRNPGYCRYHNQFGEKALGADFLAYYGLIVDFKQRKLIDTLTNLSSLGNLERHHQLHIKTVSENSIYDDILK
ncbi:hypothetical protein TNCV_2747211 [Trichonephila clavipes]|nr:hypothetical protein TNCV_2747211 [Trichonephila clavipes]